MFSSIPLPKSMAEKLNLADVTNIITEKERESDEENLFLSTINKMFCLQQYQCIEDDGDALGRETSGVVTPVVGGMLAHARQIVR